MLFYGFGSKKGLLERLAQQHLTDGGLVAFNGFVPTLTLRVILFQVATLLRTPRWSALSSAARLALWCCNLSRNLPHACTLPSTRAGV